MTDIGVDKAGVAHVVFTSPNGLAYSNNRAGGAWSTTNFDLRGGDDISCGLALDSNGKAHIAYINAGGKMRYITNATGNWVVHTVSFGKGYSGGGYSIKTIDIKVDYLDFVHIGYYEESTGSGGALYATNRPTDR